MNTKLTGLTQNPFIRNVIIMSTGTAAAQLVMLALTPVITRLYGPEAFGLMGVFKAIIGVVTPIAALTYPIAIVLPEKDDDAKSLMNLSFLISIFMTVMAVLILFIFQPFIIKTFRLDQIASFLYLIPAAIFFAGIYQTLEQWLIRQREFTVTAKAAFAQAIIIQGSEAGIGFIHPAAGVLIIMTALAEGVRSCLLISFIRKKMADLKQWKSIASLKYAAKRYRDFPVFRAPEVFLSAVSLNLPILMLTGFFGPVSAGFYTIGRSVLNIPIQLVGKSVGDVFYPRITEAANHKESTSKLIIKATLALGAIGVIPFGIVFMIGPWLFGVVFGADWVMAGHYARWIALLSLFGFMNRPSIKALPVLFAQAFHLQFTVLNLIVQTGMLAAGFYIFASDLISVALFSLAGVLLNVFLILRTIHLAKQFDQTDKGLYKE